VPQFGKTQRVLCEYLALLRNEELHTAGLPFESLPVAKWLPRFYECCDIFCTFMKQTLADYLGSDVERAAREMIRTLNTKVESEVKKRIADHKKAFLSKLETERAELVKEAAVT
jgi:hypothetical protein